MPNESRWIEDYRLGIKILDDQHKNLFNIMAQISVLDANTSNKEELKKIFGELSNYTHQHFEYEEAYMRQIGYPELEHHQKLHHEIIEFINSVVANSPTIAIIQTKLKFIIKKALINHIVDEDMKYKRYLSQHGELLDGYAKELT